MPLCAVASSRISHHLPLLPPPLVQCSPFSLFFSSRYTPHTTYSSTRPPHGRENVGQLPATRSGKVGWLNNFKEPVRQRISSQSSVASTASSQPGTPSNSAGEPIRNQRTIKNDTFTRKISFSSSAVATFIFCRRSKQKRKRRRSRSEKLLSLPLGHFKEEVQSLHQVIHWPSSHQSTTQVIYSSFIFHLL